MVRFRFKKGLSFFQKNVCWMLMHRALLIHFQNWAIWGRVHVEI